MILLAGHSSAYHSIAVSLLTGVLAFALLFAFVAAYAARRGNASLLIGSHFTTRVAAGTGLVLALAGIVTGFLIWPVEAVLASALLKNKLFAVVMLVILWGMYFAIVQWQGVTVWYRGALTVHILALAVAGFLANVIANSIGGDAAGNPSGFENIVRLFGVETRFTFYLPTWLNVTIVAVGLLALVTAFVTTRPREGTPKREEEQR